MSEIKCPKCGESFTATESSYAAIVDQVRNEEFDKSLREQISILQNEKETALKLLDEKSKASIEKSTFDLKQEIVSLKAALDISKKDSEIEKVQQCNSLEQKIIELQSVIASKDKDAEIAINKIKFANKDDIVEKDKKIIELEAKVAEAKKDSELKEKNLTENFSIQLKEKSDLIEYYKDLKLKMSTKMLGETLELHCENEFNMLRSTGFKNAYFEKDNDSKSGSKGDYIFREKTEDGVEFISIMFEMKNEMGTTTNKKKNEDFFKELDKDRREKGCEYAILVSMLEADSELYNTGIVDVSYKYPKMYVIRPQFFIAIITLLRNASLNSAQYKKEVELYRSQNIDISNFEEKIDKFKAKFSYNYNQASKKFDTAIDEIDKAIASLQKTREALKSSKDNLGRANEKAESLTIKSLTHGNPTMAQTFKELSQDKD